MHYINLDFHVAIAENLQETDKEYKNLKKQEIHDK